MSESRDHRRVRRYKRWSANSRLPISVRAGAMGALLPIPAPEAEDALLDGLADPDQRMRFMAAVFLSDRRPPVSVARIIGRLREEHGDGNPDPDRPPDACELLAFGLDEWTRLRPVEIALHDVKAGDPDLRRCAIRMMRGSRDTRVDAALAAALHDENPGVAEEARQAMAWRAASA